MFSFMFPALLISGTIFWFVRELQPVQRSGGPAVSITFEPKTGLRRIATSLQERGLIRNATAFQVAVFLAGFSKDLKAGTYEIVPTDSATAIARRLVRGSGPAEITLKIPEEKDSSLNSIGQYLESQHIGTAEEFIKDASVHDSRNLFPDEKFDFLVGRPATATLEGYLYPDTYRVFANATSQEVIKKMLDNFGTKLTPQLREGITASGFTIHQIVTLASIVELEAKTSQDRALIADIFFRRLAIGMPLESDVTVHYAMNRGGASGQVFDTAYNSPYNTYKYRGLPPGPIDNPGLVSIRAVIAPETNDWLYFLTDATGEVRYAKTYDEHLVNKAKYLP